MTVAEKRDGATRERILDTAQRLIQTRGYNAFSFKDVAEALGIRTASIHYHFPTKADLGVALLQRYRRVFRDELDAIATSTGSSNARLTRFTNLFHLTFESESRMCLCGMLSAEIATLPEPVACEVEHFFHETESWLTEVFANGRKAGLFAFEGGARAEARSFLALLEGAMVVARGLRDRGRFQAIARGHLQRLKTH
jgi:TetR/AcrR family transcriptional repressor of nem operon